MEVSRRDESVVLKMSKQSWNIKSEMAMGFNSQVSGALLQDGLRE